MSRLLVVVSGLPGSGKTTLGRELARLLTLPFIDKDAILESLFDSLDVGRGELSRASDAVLEGLVRDSQGCVVTSFWRREQLSPMSGTPTQWLVDLPDTALVEVACMCAPAVAAHRFRTRQRHVGHEDAARLAEDLEDRFEALDALGPLRLGTLIRVDTEQAVDVRSVADSIAASLR